MTFAVHRKEMNRGCPDGTGRWLFEEFMFHDSLFGRAEVTYQAQAKRIPVSDVTAMIADRYEITIYDVEVEDVVVFDDNGNVIPLPLSEVESLKAMVLEAFSRIEGDVIQHVRGTL